MLIPLYIIHHLADCANCDDKFFQLERKRTISEFGMTSNSNIFSYHLLIQIEPEMIPALFFQYYWF